MNGEMRVKKLKFRSCLVCDKQFQTFGPNHICGRCHEKHKKLFESSPSGNLEDLIYSVSPSEEGGVRVD
jgi:hypothetical protein